MPLVHNISFTIIFRFRRKLLPCNLHEFHRALGLLLILVSIIFLISHLWDYHRTTNIPRPVVRNKRRKVWIWSTLCQRINIFCFRCFQYFLLRRGCYNCSYRSMLGIHFFVWEDKTWHIVMYTLVCPNTAGILMNFFVILIQLVGACMLCVLVAGVVGCAYVAW